MDRTGEQIEPKGLLLFHAGEGDGGILVKTKDGFVTQDDGGPTVFLDPYHIAGTVGVVQLYRLPLRVARSLGFDTPLHGDNFGDPFLTRFCRHRARKEETRYDA